MLQAGSQCNLCTEKKLLFYVLTSFDVASLKILQVLKMCVNVLSFSILCQDLLLITYLCYVCKWITNYILSHPGVKHQDWF